MNDRGTGGREPAGEGEALWTRAGENDRRLADAAEADGKGGR